MTTACRMASTVLAVSVDTALMPYTSFSNASRCEQTVCIVRLTLCSCVGNELKVLFSSLSWRIVISNSHIKSFFQSISVLSSSIHRKKLSLSSLSSWSSNKSLLVSGKGAWNSPCAGGYESVCILDSCWCCDSFRNCCRGCDGEPYWTNRLYCFWLLEGSGWTDHMIWDIVYCSGKVVCAAKKIGTM